MIHQLMQQALCAEYKRLWKQNLVQSLHLNFLKDSLLAITACTMPDNPAHEVAQFSLEKYYELESKNENKNS